jgi:uncharacterized protein with GYD domain
MATFFMFGKYTSDAANKISSERTQQVRDAIAKRGGTIKDIYALLGQYDLVLIVELPNMGEAMKAAVMLGRITGISFSTAAAVSVEEFDKMVGEL